MGILDAHRMLDTNLVDLTKKFAPDRAGSIPGFMSGMTLRDALKLPIVGDQVLNSLRQNGLDTQLKQWGVTNDQFRSAISQKPPKAEPQPAPAVAPAPAPAVAAPAVAAPAPAKPPATTPAQTPDTLAGAVARVQEAAAQTAAPSAQQPAQAQPAAPAAGGGNIMGHYANAIRGIESGSPAGNYGALGKMVTYRNGSTDRAYGAYQVMGRNVPQWTKEATGTAMTPQQFLASPQAQDAVFNKHFGDAIQKYGSPEAAAREWFGGPAGMNKPGASDVNRTTVSRYAQDFNRRVATSQQGGGETATAYAPTSGGVAATPGQQAISGAVKQPSPPAAQNASAPASGPAAAKNAPASPAAAPEKLGFFQRQGFLQRDPETRQYLDPTLAKRAGARDTGLGDAVAQAVAPAPAKAAPAQAPAQAAPAQAPATADKPAGFGGEPLPFAGLGAGGKLQSGDPTGFGERVPYAGMGAGGRLPMAPEPFDTVTHPGALGAPDVPGGVTYAGAFTGDPATNAVANRAVADNLTPQGMRIAQPRPQPTPDQFSVAGGGGIVPQQGPMTLGDFRTLTQPMPLSPFSGGGAQPAQLPPLAPPPDQAMASTSWQTMPGAMAMPPWSVEAQPWTPWWLDSGGWGGGGVATGASPGGGLGLLSFAAPDVAGGMSGL